MISFIKNIYWCVKDLGKTNLSDCHVTPRKMSLNSSIPVKELPWRETVFRSGTITNLTDKK